MLKVGILGAAGRMGKTLIEVVQSTEGLSLAVAVDVPGSSLVGVDAGEMAGVGKLGVPLVDSLAEVINAADVFIDFTLPEGTAANLSLCEQHGKPIVIGTTGLTDEQKQHLQQVATKVPVCLDRKSTRLNSSHVSISYAVFCLKKKKEQATTQ